MTIYKTSRTLFIGKLAIFASTIFDILLPYILLWSTFNTSYYYDISGPGYAMITIRFFYPNSDQWFYLKYCSRRRRELSIYDNVHDA
ncbi:hypothetical protein I4U23_031083 [Adineta vaga]|nr:hypothetical protein I4U23_031083 [Adineta vaga]